MNQVFLTSKNFWHFLCSAWFHVSIFISFSILFIYFLTVFWYAWNLMHQRQSAKALQAAVEPEGGNPPEPGPQGTSVHRATCVLPP